MRRRKTPEQFRRHHVHTLVGALRREYNGNEQLKRAVVVQFRLRRRHSLLKESQGGCVSFLFGHLSCSCKLVEEAHVVLGEQTQVVDAILQVGNTFYSHAEGKTGIYIGVYSARA